MTIQKNIFKNGLSFLKKVLFFKNDQFFTWVAYMHRNGWSNSRMSANSAKLGYVLNTLHVDTVQTPFTHLPDIKCLGRLSLNIEIFNELTKGYECRLM